METRYGKQFGTAAEGEVRRLLELTDEGLITAWKWLVTWVTTDTHEMIFDPRIRQSAPASPETVLAYFEDSAAAKRAKKESRS